MKKNLTYYMNQIAKRDRQYGTMKPEERCEKCHKAKRVKGNKYCPKCAKAVIKKLRKRYHNPW